MKYGHSDKSYHVGRKTRRSHKYRLRRRAEEVVRAIQKHAPQSPERIIDLGTADGLGLGIVKDHFPETDCIGVEYVWDLAATNANPDLVIMQGDANYLPTKGGTVDVVTGTAFIEHLPQPEIMLQEARRVLKPHGIIILTTPDPFWEGIASKIGHLSPHQHPSVMDMKTLATLLKDSGYVVLEKRKFMLSPIGMPGEGVIEDALRSFKMNFLFANQLVVGRKA
ncbi:MAG: class I SAM-dependent methyltransferase [Deltaproteobacteria bacterium]|nr:class I SAM-dependent methyltransferase [Deltaproteobacteria bacterium]